VKIVMLVFTQGITICDTRWTWLLTKPIFKDTIASTHTMQKGIFKFINIFLKSTHLMFKTLLNITLNWFTICFHPNDHWEKLCGHPFDGLQGLGRLQKRSFLHSWTKCFKIIKVLVLVKNLVWQYGLYILILNYLNYISFKGPIYNLLMFY